MQASVQLTVSPVCMPSRLAVTTARGRNGGREHRLPPEQVLAAKDLRAAGRSVKEASKLLGDGKPVSRQMVYWALGTLDVASLPCSHSQPISAGWAAHLGVMATMAVEGLLQD